MNLEKTLKILDDSNIQKYLIKDKNNGFMRGHGFRRDSEYFKENVKDLDETKLSDLIFLFNKLLINDDRNLSNSNMEIENKINNLEILAIKCIDINLDPDINCYIISKLIKFCEDATSLQNLKFKDLLIKYFNEKYEKILINLTISPDKDLINDICRIEYFTRTKLLSSNPNLLNLIYELFITDQNQLFTSRILPFVLKKYLNSSDGTDIPEETRRLIFLNLEENNLQDINLIKDYKLGFYSNPKNKSLFTELLNTILHKYTNLVNSSNSNPIDRLLKEFDQSTVGKLKIYVCDLESKLFELKNANDKNWESKMTTMQIWSHDEQKIYIGNLELHLRDNILPTNDSDFWYIFSEYLKLIKNINLENKVSGIWADITRVESTTHSFGNSTDTRKLEDIKELLISQIIITFWRTILTNCNTSDFINDLINKNIKQKLDCDHNFKKRYEDLPQLLNYYFWKLKSLLNLEKYDELSAFELTSLYESIIIKLERFLVIIQRKLHGVETDLDLNSNKIVTKVNFDKLIEKVGEYETFFQYINYKYFDSGLDDGKRHVVAHFTAIKKPSIQSVIELYLTLLFVVGYYNSL